MTGILRRLLICSVLLGMLGLAPPRLAATYAQGAVYTDAMDSPATGLLRSEATTDARSAYQNGQFVIQTVNAGYSGDLAAFPAVPSLPDVSVAVDVSVAPDLTGKYAFVGCRGSNTSAYLFELHPDTRSVNLWRLDSDNMVSLGAATDVAAANAGSDNNRLEIRCVGNTITGLINGQQVLTAQDATYSSGDVFIGTGKDATTTDVLLTGFDNLTITELGGSNTITQPTQAAVPPTQVAVPPAVPTVAMGGDQTGLTPITEPSVDPAATFRDAQRASVGGVPLLLQKDDIPFQLTTGIVKTVDTGMQLTDFYAELHFQVQSDITGSGLLFSYQFWSDGNDNGYQFAIGQSASVSSWLLAYDGPGGHQDIAKGDIPTGAIDLTPGAANVMCLAVYHGFAILSVNGFTPDAVEPLTLPAAGSRLLISTVFMNPSTTGPMTMNGAITLMGVWDLSSGGYVDIFGLSPTDPTPVPAAQTATTPAASQRDDSAAWSFVIERAAASTIGIGFRDVYDSNDYRFALQSTGNWWLARGADVGVVQGAVANVGATRGARTTIELARSTARADWRSTMW